MIQRRDVHVLIADDDEPFRRGLSILVTDLLKAASCSAAVHEAKDVEQARAIIDENQQLDVLFVDLADQVQDKLLAPGIITYLETKRRDLLNRTVVLSALVNKDGEERYSTIGPGRPSLPTAEERREWPIFDILSKPPDERQIQAVIEHLCGLERRPPTRAELAAESKRMCSKDAFAKVAGTAPSLRAAMHRAMLIAEELDTNVLLLGESGTGKELLAEAINTLSRTSRDPIAVNMGAITPTLWAAEFFGVEGKTVTGVDAGPGYFEQADGGTLFLDEIGDMPRENQPALLRVLQTPKFRRVRGKKDILVQFRLISATDKTLRQLAEDLDDALFWRLSHAVITLPPLRQRFAEDSNEIDILLLHELKTLGWTNLDIDEIVSPGARKVLLGYPWPGNYRTFQRAVRTIVRHLKAAGTRRQITTVEAKDALLTLPAFAPATAPTPEPAVDGAYLLLQDICRQLPTDDWKVGEIYRKIFASARLHLLDAMKRDYKTDGKLGLRYGFGNDEKKAAAVVRAQRHRATAILCGAEDELSD